MRRLSLLPLVVLLSCGEDGTEDGAGSGATDMGSSEQRPDMAQDGRDVGQGTNDMGSEAPDMSGAGTEDLGVEDMGREGDLQALAALDEADANPGDWTWVPVEGALCRDGSGTGFLMRTQAEATNLMIYLEGGGACFNQFTCPTNPSSFGAGNAASQSEDLTDGIFDDTSPDNPVANWNVAYFPYCTGDVFAGTTVGGTVSGAEGPQDFVGFDNVALFSGLLADRYADSSSLLVTGISAGGFGAFFNFDQIAARFPEAEKTLLDDSGQPLAFGDALSPCLTQQWVDLWGIPLPDDCADCTPSTDGLRGIARYLRQKYPDAGLGLSSYLRDSVIRTFFLFGKNECSPTNPAPIAGADFEDAVLDFRDDHPDWATFFVDGVGHTFLGGNRGFQQTPSGGLALSDWLGALLDGDAQDLGPDQ